AGSKGDRLEGCTGLGLVQCFPAALDVPVGHGAEVGVGAEGEGGLARGVDQEVHAVYVHVCDEVARVGRHVDVVDDAAVVLSPRHGAHVDVSVGSVGASDDVAGATVGAARGSAPALVVVAVQVTLPAAVEVGGDDFAGGQGLVQ